MSMFVICLLLTLSTRPATLDWTQWGGPDRSFVAVDAPPLADSWPSSGPPVRWSALLGPGHSGVVARDGVVYTAFRDGEHDVVIAIDGVSGREHWRHRDHAPAHDFMAPRYGAGPHSTPLVTKSSVFLAGSTGHLIALERGDGAERWKVRMWDDLDGTRVERGYAASPLAYDDTIIVPVGGEGRAVVAFRQSDGGIKWSKHDFAAAYASPVLLDVGERTHACVLLRDVLLGLDPRTGELLWQTPINGERYAICSTPLTGPGPQVLVINATGAEMYEVDGDAASGYRAGRKWLSRRIGSQDHNVLRVANRIIGSNSSTTMAVIDAETGAPLVRTRENADASVLFADGKLLSISEDGALSMSRVRGDRLETIGRVQLLSTRCWSAPALVGSTLYVRDLERLVAVELGVPDPDVLPR